MVPGTRAYSTASRAEPISNGGSAGAGAVFKLDTKGHESTLYSFTGGNDGANPYAGVILDSAGNLYGTTYGGGLDGAGVVFKLDPAGRDSAGNLYGTTEYGGRGPCIFFGCGVVFQLDPAGHETILYSFSGGADGSNPETGVIRDAAGTLYGTTVGGGSGAGVVYKVTPDSNSTAVTQSTLRPLPPPRFGPKRPLPGQPPEK